MTPFSLCDIDDHDDDDDATTMVFKAVVLVGGPQKGSCAPPVSPRPCSTAACFGDAARRRCAAVAIRVLPRAAHRRDGRCAAELPAQLVDARFVAQRPETKASLGTNRVR